MAARRFKVGSRIVTFTWQLFFKNMQLYFEHQLVGTVGNSEELRSGKEFKLEDGTILKLKLESWPSTGINLYVNGRLAEGSADHSTNQSHLLFGLFFAIGVIYIGLASGKILLHLPVLESFGFRTMVVGCALVGISYYAKRTSLPAIFLAVAVYILDTFATFYLQIENQVPLQPTATVAKFLLMFFMIRASLSIHKAKLTEIPSELS